MAGEHRTQILAICLVTLALHTVMWAWKPHHHSVCVTQQSDITTTLITEPKTGAGVVTQPGTTTDTAASSSSPPDSASSSPALPIVPKPSKVEAPPSSESAGSSSSSSAEVEVSVAPPAPPPPPPPPPKPREPREKIAAIVESRPISRVWRVIDQFMERLGDDWDFQFYHGTLNRQTVEHANSTRIQDAIKSKRLRFMNLDRETFDIPYYNRLFVLNATFWEGIGGKKILIFQVDSCLCANSPRHIDSFMHFDYIGAPWYADWFGDLGGNGGLSLRSTQKMLECVRGWGHTQQPQPGNEDGFFTDCIGVKKVQGRICTKAEAREFSVETIYYPTPLGVHNAWMYLKPDEFEQLRKYCPETEDARSFSKHS